MSEPHATPEPKKEGGLKQPDQRPSEPALSKTGGGEERDPQTASDVELEDSPGGREGGMIGEG
jgi:hypothetical protein